ncbi:hypothetical protein [Burkholderia cenocepacia]|uniref:hypothetical protein n=1 Tax=Burkholderia cenocepacia TaxID=95486 RepID=UPI0026564CE5|nr:hypothetical protein [Burkholderia cenocepacia]MDN7549479.1 hypothetical protein [Burkholderia cenocepacia]MDN7631413.1 hypothetical protein [Burkholderia cenocepacia]
MRIADVRPQLQRALSMKTLEEMLSPDRQAFAADPFGYSALAWQKWAIAQSLAGLRTDPEAAPTSYDLKSPVLWLTQAHALSEAAASVLRGHPELDHLPLPIRGICDGQYCAVGLMLMGYSLEISLKAMRIIRNGVDGYQDSERKHKHHRLADLSDFVPNLGDKDKVILRLLTHFLKWAGRYPDPGAGREADAQSIFELSEMHQISATDLFGLAARVMGHAKILVDKPSSDVAPG